MADARMDPETKERLDGEHGGITLAKATKKRKQWDAAEVSSGDDGEGAEDAGPRRSTKVKAEEKNVEEKEDEAEEKAEEAKEEKPLDKKEKAKQVKKIQELKKQLDKDLAPLLGNADSKAETKEVDEDEGKSKKQKKQEEKDEDVTKGKDDLGDFEERAAKKAGEPDQFVDPFKRKDKVKAKDIDQEIDEE